MTRARIYRRPKKATQSGNIHDHIWVLDYGQSLPRSHDPVTGWVGSKDTQAQVKLSFESKEQAVEYAERNAIAYDIEEAVARRYVAKVYEDNFNNKRKMNWSH